MATKQNSKIRNALITELRRNTERSLLNKSGRAEFNQLLNTADQFPKTVARVRQQAVATIAKDEAFQELRQIYANANEELTERELAALSEDPPERPHFPWIIFTIALLKDGVDAVTGSVLSIIASALYFVILFVYYLGKIGFGSRGIIRGSLRSKMLKQWFTKVSVGAGLDAFWGVGFLPISCVTVIFAHYRNVKIFHVTLTALEALQKGEMRAIKRESARLRSFAREQNRALTAA